MRKSERHFSLKKITFLRFFSIVPRDLGGSKAA